MLNSLLVKSIIKKDIESGEITVDTSKKMDKENPSGTGSFSMNRKADTEVGANSTTEGTENVASGENSHAEGKTSTASGHASHAEGRNSKASGTQAHAEGSSTASGKNSHSEGTATKATSEASHAEGYYTIAGGGSAHAEGNNSSAIGNSSHAEGYYAHADGASSHSEGQYTYSEGTASHSEGEYSKAQGIDSHAEGNRTTALGKTSHSEGSSTNNANTSRIQSDTSNDDVITYWESSKFSLAKGEASHVEGKDCLALGDYSHSGGIATRAGYQSQTAIGEYNENKEEDIFEVGNGTSDARSNALELTKTGDLKIGGSYIDGSGNALSVDSANEYTDKKIADLINGAPTTLDTLKEIADTMEENQDVVKALDESIGAKANVSDLTDHTGNTNNPHNVTAEQTPYDNIESGLSAQNVQDAVDEVNENFNNLENEIDEKVGQNGCGEIAGGKNIANPDNFKDGKVVDFTSGAIIDNSEYFVSGYIAVEPSTIYTKQGFSIGLENWYYDENKNAISNISTDTFTTPSNAKYVVLSALIENKSICMLEKGSIATPYEPYYPSNKMLAENKADKSQVTTNLLKPTLQTTTSSGVTCTNNGDGTYTLNGTATGENAVFRVNISCIEYGKTYRLVGCPQSGGSGKYGLEATDQTIYGVNDYGDGAIFNPYETGYEYKILIVVYMNHTANNLVFKPMLTTNLSATYEDFVPFTGTTGQLNSDVAELEKSNEGKMGKENPTGTGAFSMNRKADTTVGDYSTTEGSNCEASAICSHAEGSDTIAKESCSHAEGNHTTASGFYSHAEGYKTTASNTSSHAEGNRTTASGDYGSHAEGNQTTAKGNSSHAEGFDTTASGSESHSEGYNTKAEGDYSHSGGYRTIAGHNSQTAIGKYNDNKEEDIFEVGNGTSDTERSNALELTKTGDLKIAGGLVDNVLSMIVDHIYEGVDLTVKFASEIANYSDEWAWIKSRVTDGNYSGIHVCDYIPITCSNGYILNAQIAGINTYTGYGDGDERVGNNIDFICKELWDDLHVMNKVNYNNGNANSPSPFLASDLNYWINSMSGTVPNSESDPSVTTEVDYTAGGVLYYLPDKLKNQIITKRIPLPSRYIAGQVLTNDNAWAWKSTGKLWIPSEVEVYGAPCWGNSGYGMGGFVQYPLFDCNMNRAKLRCARKDRGNWWLLSENADYSTHFADVDGYGHCNCTSATNTRVSAPVCFRI